MNNLDDKAVDRIREIVRRPDGATTNDFTLQDLLKLCTYVSVAMEVQGENTFSRGNILVYYNNISTSREVLVSADDPYISKNFANHDDILRRSENLAVVFFCSDGSRYYNSLNIYASFKFHNVRFQVLLSLGGKRLKENTSTA